MDFIQFNSMWPVGGYFHFIYIVDMDREEE